MSLSRLLLTEQLQCQVYLGSSRSFNTLPASLSSCLKYIVFGLATIAFFRNRRYLVLDRPVGFLHCFSEALCFLALSYERSFLLQCLTSRRSQTDEIDTVLDPENAASVTAVCAGHCWCEQKVRNMRRFRGGTYIYPLYTKYQWLHRVTKLRNFRLSK